MTAYLIMHSIDNVTRIDVKEIFAYERELIKPQEEGIKVSAQDHPIRREEAIRQTILNQTVILKPMLILEKFIIEILSGLPLSLKLYT